MQSKFELGSEVLERLTGKGAQTIIEAHGEVAPDLARNIVEFVFGEIYARDGLDLKTKQLITISCLATLGYAQPQLSYHIKAALNIGISQKEIIDLITHIIPYAGFPAALTALSLAKEVFKSDNCNKKYNDCDEKQYKK